MEKKLAQKKVQYPSMSIRSNIPAFHLHVRLEYINIHCLAMNRCEAWVMTCFSKLLLRAAADKAVPNHCVQCTESIPDSDILLACWDPHATHIEEMNIQICSIDMGQNICIHHHTSIFSFCTKTYFKHDGICNFHASRHSADHQDLKQQAPKGSVPSYQTGGWGRAYHQSWNNWHRNYTNLNTSSWCAHVVLGRHSKAAIYVTWNTPSDDLERCLPFFQSDLSSSYSMYIARWDSTPMV